VSTAVEARATRGMVQLALEKMRRSHYAEARHDLEAALRAEPEQPWAMSYYGLCLAHLGDVERGLKFCAFAVERQPADVVLRVNLGKVHRMAGNNAAAHRAFVFAWKVDRRHPGPASELARMGIRRPPVLGFLPRNHWCNRQLGRLRFKLEHAFGGRPSL